MNAAQTYKQLVAVIALTAFCLKSNALDKLPNTYLYDGPKIESIALCVQGSGSWPRELLKHLARELEAAGYRVIDASPITTTAADNDEVLKRITGAGYTHVMFIDVGATSQLNGALMPSTSLTVNVQIRDVTSVSSWRTSYSDHSAAMGRGGKLIRAASKSVIDAMKRDGLIVR